RQQGERHGPLHVLLAAIHTREFLELDLHPRQRDEQDGADDHVDHEGAETREEYPEKMQLHRPPPLQLIRLPRRTIQYVILGYQFCPLPSGVRSRTFHSGQIISTCRWF